MSTAFDSAARAYDRDFSRSLLGLAQRGQVWNHLEPLLRSAPIRVLELNCGTGVDARHIASFGHSVLATDASEGMLRAARAVIEDRTGPGQVTYEHLSFADIGARAWRNAFDLVLSDFGGLNCIDKEALSVLCDPLAEALVPGGRFIAVLMPDRSLVETGYFLLKGRVPDAFRRWQKPPVQARVGDGHVATWYHSPGAMARAFSSRFRVRRLRPIGFFIPPGYLEPRFVRRPALARALSRADDRVRDQRWLARLADHYLIDLERTR